MKGSPIVATVLACLIMLSMYVGMRLVFTQDTSIGTDPAATISPNQQSQGTITTYAELFLSAKAKSLKLTHPATKTELLNLENITDYEWNGELQLPAKSLNLTSDENLSSTLTDELEILCKVTWKESLDSYQFVQLTLSPDGRDAQTQTLRSQGDITDIMSFYWKEDNHD